MTAETEAPPRARVLTRIVVEQLFGRYTYEIPFDSKMLDPDLSILYGENGAGKTTILKLLHNSVSSATGRGHKTDMVRVPFKTFAAHFSGGIVLTARRDHASPGSFYMDFRQRGRKAESVFFEAVEGAITVRGKFAGEQDEFLKKIASVLNLTSYFLADERVLESDRFEDEEEHIIYDYGETGMSYRILTASSSRAQNAENQRDLQVATALRRVRQWASPQAVSGGNLGSVNTNTIYADLAKRLSAEPELEKSLELQTSSFDVIDVIGGLVERTAAQDKFGLTPRLQARDLLEAIRHAPPERRGLIIWLLEPYLNSIRARLDAMEELHGALTAFTDSLNSFLLDKKVTFDVRRGIMVHTDRGDRLLPNALSSGEKQLLLLFCNLLVSRHNPSIFLIDEPEISLNVKWQRKLIPALLSLTSGSQIQLLMATHSIELLSHYRSRVVRLPFGADQ